MAKDYEQLYKNQLEKNADLAQKLIDRIRILDKTASRYERAFEEEERLAPKTKCHRAEHESKAKIYFDIERELTDEISYLCCWFDNLGFTYSPFEQKILFFDGDEVVKFH